MGLSDTLVAPAPRGIIDPNTGTGTMVSNNGIAWWGAAVTTLAPVLQ